LVGDEKIEENFSLAESQQLKQTYIDDFTAKLMKS